MSDKKTEKNSKDYSYIAELISIELLQLEGVSCFADVGITGAIKNTVFRRDSYFKGIVIASEDDMLDIWLYINVYFGINIPQLSYDIQSHIKNIVEEKTKEKIKAINVIVQGIDKTKE